MQIFCATTIAIGTCGTNWLDHSVVPKQVHIPVTRRLIDVRPRFMVERELEHVGDTCARVRERACVGLRVRGNAARTTPAATAGAAEVAEPPARLARLHARSSQDMI
jgi:hypothetical protein